MTSAPEPELRASSMNALAHGADSLYTPFANPVSRMTALRGAELIATSLDEDPAERNRAALAQGSILSGYAIDSGAFSLHHVICQTLVRVCGGPHAAVNAAILPRAMAFMAPRAPDGLEPLATAIGTDPGRHRSPPPRARRQPARPGRPGRRSEQAPRSPGRDAAAPGAGFHAGAADPRRAGALIDAPGSGTGHPSERLELFRTALRRQHPLSTKSREEGCPDPAGNRVPHPV